MQGCRTRLRNQVPPQASTLADRLTHLDQRRFLAEPDVRKLCRNDHFFAVDLTGEQLRLEAGLDDRGGLGSTRLTQNVQQWQATKALHACLWRRRQTAIRLSQQVVERDRIGLLAVRFLGRFLTLLCQPEQNPGSDQPDPNHDKPHYQQRRARGPGQRAAHQRKHKRKQYRERGNDVQKHVNPLAKDRRA